MMDAVLVILLMAACVALVRAEVHLALLRMQVRALHARMDVQREMYDGLLVQMRALRNAGLTREEARVRALCAAHRGEHLRLVDRVRAAEGDVPGRAGPDGGAA